MLYDRSCPVCASNNNTVIWEEKFIQASHILQGVCVIRCCNECGMAFASPVPEQADWDEYYARMSKYDALTPVVRLSDVDRFREVVSFIEGYERSKDISIIDIGCGSGGLLKELHVQGYKNLFGLDPSPKVAELFSKQNSISISTASVNNFSPLRTFDLVFLIGVLEHIMDVPAFLDKIAGLQQSLGLVYIEVPNAHKFPECTDGPFQQFSVEHINFFSYSQLTQLMHQFGYDPVAEKEYTFYINKNIPSPSLMSLWKKSSEENFNIKNNREISNTELKRELMRYIENSTIWLSKLQESIKKLVDRDEEIIVWGAGTLTLRLLSHTCLRSAKIRAVVDSNSNYQGHSIGGIPILLPEQIVDMNLPILIASYIHQQEIMKQAREIMGLHNRLILLTGQEA